MNLSSTQLILLIAILIISLCLAMSKIKHLVAKLNKNKKQIERLTEQCVQLENKITYQHTENLVKQDDLLSQIQTLKFDQERLIEFAKEAKVKKERTVYALERVKKREKRLLNQQSNVIAR